MNCLTSRFQVDHKGDKQATLAKEDCYTRSRYQRSCERTQRFPGYRLSFAPITPQMKRENTWTFSPYVIREKAHVIRQMTMLRKKPVTPLRRTAISLPSQLSVSVQRGRYVDFLSFGIEVFCLSAKSDFYRVLFLKKIGEKFGDRSQVYAAKEKYSLIKISRCNKMDECDLFI